MNPKRISQIWLGPNPLPDPYKEWRDGILRLHPKPDWECYLFNDDDAGHILGKELISKFDTYSAMSDLLRWEILVNQGGIYLDTDFEIWKCLGDLPPNWMGIYHDPKVQQSYPLPGACAFEAGHPFARWCLEQTWKRVKDGRTCPHDLGPIAHTAWHCAPGRFDVAFLPPEYFYPYMAIQKESRPEDYRKKGRYGAHHWGGSWWSPKRPQPLPAIDRQKVIEPGKPYVGGYTPGPVSIEPEIWELLRLTINPKRVVDLGCGEGYAMRWWQSCGVETVGIDGSKTAITTVRESMSKHQSLAAATAILHDIQDGIPDNLWHEKGTLVWCCEVVEHIEEGYVEQLLDLLTFGDYLVMTYAAPGQPGYHHVNCQPQSYWIEKVEARGFKYNPEETDRLRNRARLHGARVLYFKRK